jgi:hypothetical protein
MPEIILRLVENAPGGAIGIWVMIIIGLIQLIMAIEHNKSS